MSGGCERHPKGSVVPQKMLGYLAADFQRNLGVSKQEDGDLNVSQETGKCILMSKKMVGI
jgi:hypothetical protein